MQITSKHLFAFILMFAVSSALIASYLRRPPTSYGSSSNHQRVLRDGEEVMYYRVAIENYNEMVLGYFTKTTLTSSEIEGDDRVTIKRGQLFLDGKRIHPVRGKIIVLLRENLGTPTIVELTSEEVHKYLDFWAGSGYEDQWENLWEDLSKKERL